MDARKKLADALIADHEVTHSSESIEEAIAIYDGVLQHKPPDHEQRAGAVSDLGDALYRACVYHQADPTRSRRCFELLREGLQLRPQGHAARSYSLDSLAQALLWVDDDKHAGDRLGACAESILLSREALQLRPDGHAERARSLGNLAIGLMRSFDHGRDLNVLAEALDLLRENLRLRPPGHPRRDASLNNLAVTLLYSFQEQGGFATLAELIDMHRQVLLLRPLGHPLRYTTLDNLAVAIRTSFTLQGSPQLLSEAIALHREAVDVIPEAHPDRGRIVCNLAEALVREFEQDGSLAVLDESITLLRGALRSPTNDGAEYFRLAKALLARFDVDKDRGHLTEAAALHREALKLCEPDSINRLESLRSFGCLLCRSECQSWVEALVLFREAVEMCPYGSSGRARLLSDLSQCFLNPESQLFDFSEGLSLVSEAHSDTFSHVNWRLRLASLNMQRVEIAYEHVLGKDLTLDSKRNFSRRVLELYAQVISLLPRAANFGLDHDARLHAIAGSDRLVRDAAARALRLDDISQAVEMLEEGRSIFWTQTLHLRASAFDGVPDEDHTELVRLLNLLEHGASRVYASKQTVTQRERDLEARRKLNEQAEALIIRIRGYAGLGRFLLPPAFETLLGALPDGYVVIVNASHIGHHALLLNRVAGLASNVELNPPRVDFDPIALRAQLPRDLKLHAAEMANRAMRLVARTHDNLDEVLNDLWTSIVLPILNHLRLEVRNSPKSRARIS
jgi:tetratricopeptide (TPR) repeat protein